MSCSSSRYSDPCCPSNTELDPAQEPLDSESANMIDSLYGSVTKTIDEETGEIVWTLPCDLNTGIIDNPRNTGEGLLCYFLRLFTEGVLGAIGPEGPPGEDGPAGPAAYSTVATAFAAPTLDSPLFSMVLVSAAWVAEGMLLFVEGLGWVRVESKSGNTVLATVMVLVDVPEVTIDVGSGVAPTGPQGSAAVVPTVATPTFLPTTGNFEGTVEVSVSTTTPLADIYYTTNGSTPTILSTPYAGPFDVTATTTIKALAVRAGYNDSGIGSKTYVLVENILGYYGSSLLDTVVGEDWDTALTAWSQTVDDYENDPTTYSFAATIAGGGDAAGPYRYYIVEDTGIPAAAVGGFFTSLNLAPEDLASTLTGWPDYDQTDANGWPYLEYDDGDTVWRVYRLLNELNGAFTLKVQQF